MNAAAINTPELDAFNRLWQGANSGRVGDYELLSAALERARVVAVLDGWRFRGGRRYWFMAQGPGGDELETCNLSDDMAAPGSRNRAFRGSTPDAARAAAAKAIEAGEV